MHQEYNFLIKCSVYANIYLPYEWYFELIWRMGSIYKDYDDSYHIISIEGK